MIKHRIHPYEHCRIKRTMTARVSTIDILDSIHNKYLISSMSHKCLDLCLLDLKDLRWSLRLSIQAKHKSRLLNRNTMFHLLLLLDGITSCSEDNIELLQRSLLRLNEEEVDDWAEAEVEDCENDVLNLG